MKLPLGTKYKLGVSIRSLLVVGSMFFWTPAAILADTIPEAVTRIASELLPGISPDSIAPTPITNLYLVAFGAQVYYITKDGRYLISGNLIELENFPYGRNLTEDVKTAIQKRLIDELDESGMVIFSPSRVASTITVFTDVTCGYCVRLHQDINQLAKAGIKVRYLGYPRAGIPSDAHDTLVSIWCANDPQRAMTNAKAGREIEKVVCETPIREHMAVAEQLGGRGTPTVFLQNGVKLPGYLPADELVQHAYDAANTGG